MNRCHISMTRSKKIVNSLLTTPASSLCTLTRLTDTGVPLPLVSAAAVGRARRGDAGVAHIAARLYFDSS